MAPAWANSLFEDNAEFGYGMRVAAAQREALVAQKVDEVLENGCADDLKAALENWKANRHDGLASQEAAEAVKALLPEAIKADRQECRGACKVIENNDGSVGEKIHLDASAATVGPTISVTAASTMFSPWAKTSMSWCSTRKYIPTRAARPPNSRRPVLLRKFAASGKRVKKKGPWRNRA